MADGARERAAGALVGRWRHDHHEGGWKEAEQQLDFKYVEIYSSTMKLNARRGGAAEPVPALPLGVRLWRYPDKGSKYDTEVDKGKVHKVFISFSPRVAEMLRERIIKVDF